jgi:tetratricopeptide (TPR) repeat protein
MLLRIFLIFSNVGILIKSKLDMKKRTAFVGAILSLIPLGQPILLKTGVVLSTIGVNFLHAEKSLANSFNVDYDNGKNLFDAKKYSEAISIFAKILKKYSNLSNGQKSDIYLFLAMSHGYLNKHNVALEFNNKSISLNPLNSVLYLDRANTKFQLNDKKGACLDMRVGFELSGDDIFIADVANEYLDKWRCN